MLVKIANLNCIFEIYGQQYNYHALCTDEKVLENCTEEWKERGGLMKLSTKKNLESISRYSRRIPMKKTVLQQVETFWSSLLP